mmetsp:Transcript_81915/g.127954  ORF Transcript_81915/g.127954 Transcript_81915/m.127954 type:complete len:214 (-) Transcript_81915:156-797(-)
MSTGAETSLLTVGGGELGATRIKPSIASHCELAISMARSAPQALPIMTQVPRPVSSKVAFTTLFKSSSVKADVISRFGKATEMPSSNHFACLITVPHSSSTDGEGAFPCKQITRPVETKLAGLSCFPMGSARIHSSGPSNSEPVFRTTTRPEGMPPMSSNDFEVKQEALRTDCRVSRAGLLELAWRTEVPAVILACRAAASPSKPTSRFSNAP